MKKTIITIKPRGLTGLRTRPITVEVTGHDGRTHEHHLELRRDNPLSVTVVDETAPHAPDTFGVSRERFPALSFTEGKLLLEVHEQFRDYVTKALAPLELLLGSYLPDDAAKGHMHKKVESVIDEIVDAFAPAIKAGELAIDAPVYRNALEKFAGREIGKAKKGKK